jgi:hypothetical protein
MGRWRRPLAWTLVVVLAMAALPAQIDQRSRLAKGPFDYASAAQAVQAQQRPGDLLLATNVLLRTGLTYQLDGQGPDQQLLPRRLWVGAPPDQIGQDVDRVWLASSLVPDTPDVDQALLDELATWQRDGSADFGDIRLTLYSRPDGGTT